MKSTHSIRPGNLGVAGGLLLALCCCATLSLKAQPFPGFGGNFGGNTGSRSSRSTTTYPSSTDVGQARISVDPETRNLIVVADDATAEQIKAMVKQLDKPAPQVLIKVVFLEVTYNKGSDIGISGSYTKNLSWSGNNFTGMVTQAFNGLSGLSSGAGAVSILANDFQATLKAIAEAGKVEVLSRPSILARNNQQATINVGQQVPLITNVRYDNFGNQINGITYQNVGIILTVTPFITSDGMVEMVLAPQISSVSDSSVNISSGSNSVAAPIINIRSADTVVVTPDNQTVVIGGLMSTRKAENESKIPVLGDIPVLGMLFKRKVKSNEKTELMIFLTPTIVRDPRELAQLSAKENANSQVATNAFTEQELERYLNQKPAGKSKLPDPPPPKK